ncbi:hypothetical protein H8959_022219 [Pygathrix nigripes]
MADGQTRSCGAAASNRVQGPPRLPGPSTQGSRTPGRPLPAIAPGSPRNGRPPVLLQAASPPRACTCSRGPAPRGSRGVSPARLQPGSRSSGPPSPPSCGPLARTAGSAGGTRSACVSSSPRARRAPQRHGRSADATETPGSVEPTKPRPRTSGARPGPRPRPRHPPAARPPGAIGRACSALRALIGRPEGRSDRAARRRRRRLRERDRKGRSAPASPHTHCGGGGAAGLGGAGRAGGGAGAAEPGVTSTQRRQSARPPSPRGAAAGRRGEPGGRARPGGGCSGRARGEGRRGNRAAGVSGWAGGCGALAAAAVAPVLGDAAGAPFRPAVSSSGLRACSPPWPSRPARGVCGRHPSRRWGKQLHSCAGCAGARGRVPATLTKALTLALPRFCLQESGEMPLLDRVVVRLCDCMQTPEQDTGVHLWKIGQGTGPCWCEWCRNPLLIRPASRLPTPSSLALSLHTQCPAVPEGTQPTSLTTTPLSQKTAAPFRSSRLP